MERHSSEQPRNDYEDFINIQQEQKKIYFTALGK
jgi:hypothetical protein